MRILKQLITAGLIICSTSTYAMINYSGDDVKKFKDTGNCPKCDLSGTTFNYTNHPQANLEGAIIAGSTFDGDYSKANFSSVNGAHANLSINASGANFSHANLINAHFSYTFTNADFSNAILINANLYGSYYGSGTIFTNANFTNALLRSADAHNADFTGADFTNAIVQNADFSGANLYGAKITEEQLATVKSVCNAILPSGSTGKCKS